MVLWLCLVGKKLSDGDALKWAQPAQLGVVDTDLPSLERVPSLKVNGWKMTLSFWGNRPIFRGKLDISFREATVLNFQENYNTPLEHTPGNRPWPTMKGIPL